MFFGAELKFGFYAEGCGRTIEGFLKGEWHDSVSPRGDTEEKRRCPIFPSLSWKFLSGLC